LGFGPDFGGRESLTNDFVEKYCSFADTAQVMQIANAALSDLKFVIWNFLPIESAE